MSRNTPSFAFLVSALLLAAVGCTAESQAKAKAGEADQSRETTKARSFAVVELFTSEGCSSSPPAERLLSKIHEKAKAEASRVITVEFHVTYWDDLGWVDPFGDKAYTRRQRRYARAFGNDKLYTPQMVVNGTSEFVGSNATKAHRAIDQALGSKSPIALHLEQAQMERESADTRKLHLSYALSKATSGNRLNIAITEDHLSKHVRRGENRGRTLHHDAVVRVFEQIKPKQSGETTLTVPAEIDLENASVIAYLQDRSSMAILAATRTELASDSVAARR